MMRRNPPFDSDGKRSELLQRLNAIPPVNLPADSIARMPTLPLSALAAKQDLEQFKKAIEWTIAEVKAHQGSLLTI